MSSLGTNSMKEEEVFETGEEVDEIQKQNNLGCSVLYSHNRKNISTDNQVQPSIDSHQIDARQAFEVFQGTVYEDKADNDAYSYNEYSKKSQQMVAKIDMDSDLLDNASPNSSTLFTYSDNIHTDRSYHYNKRRGKGDGPQQLTIIERYRKIKDELKDLQDDVHILKSFGSEDLDKENSSSNVDSNSNVKSADSNYNVIDEPRQLLVQLSKNIENLGTYVNSDLKYALHMENKFDTWFNPISENQNAEPSTIPENTSMKNYTTIQEKNLSVEQLCDLSKKLYESSFFSSPLNNCDNTENEMQTRMDKESIRGKPIVIEIFNKGLPMTNQAEQIQPSRRSQSYDEKEIDIFTKLESKLNKLEQVVGDVKVFSSTHTLPLLTDISASTNLQSNQEENSNSSEPSSNEEGGLTRILELLEKRMIILEAFADGIQQTQSKHVKNGKIDEFDNTSKKVECDLGVINDNSDLEKGYYAPASHLFVNKIHMIHKKLSEIQAAQKKIKLDGSTEKLQKYYENTQDTYSNTSSEIENTERKNNDPQSCINDVANCIFQNKINILHSQIHTVAPLLDELPALLLRLETLQDVHIEATEVLNRVKDTECRQTMLLEKFDDNKRILLSLKNNLKENVERMAQNIQVVDERICRLGRSESQSNIIPE